MKAFTKFSNCYVLSNILFKLNKRSLYKNFSSLERLNNSNYYQINERGHNGGVFLVKRNIWQRFDKWQFGSYSIIKKPSSVNESQPIPTYITKPSYAETGMPTPAPFSAEIKNEKQIDGIREACRLARSVLNEISGIMKVGVTTEDIDVIVRNKIISTKSYPSPLNYRGFPKSCCTSVNNVACHGIPDNRPLEDGDIISVDVTVFHKGFHGDCCETYLIGNVDEAGVHLVDTAKECRDKAIEVCGPNVPFRNIGLTVEEIAEKSNLCVVPAFTGHGIGEYFHGPPDVYHCVNNYPGEMKPGMTFTVEPVIAQGSEEAVILEDGWTAVMLDNGRAAQFEHTILITDKGSQILTNY